jgi:16S rRNA (guanine966-N2)-methyltransferase
MRVIAGEFKGRRLRAPDTDATRPVTDRVKESIFSSLGDRVVRARVVDLYAGAGSFGIEALSRGAASAVFVENGRKAIEALRSNLDLLGLEVDPVRRRVEDYIRQTDRTFDLVFCDPPWTLDEESVERILADLHRAVADDGLVILTRRSTDPVPEPSGYRIDDDRRMGDTRIIRYAKMDDV